MLTLLHNGENVPLQITEYYVRELASGLDEIIFDISIWDPVYAQMAEQEDIVDRGGQAYLIKQVDAGAVTAKVICQLDLDEWRAAMNVGYDSGSHTVAEQIDAVKPSGWTVIDRSGSSIQRTLHGDYTPLEVCEACRSVYNVYIRWDNKRKEVTIYPQAMSAPVGSFATRELNLKEINYKGKSTDFATRIYPYGKDDMSIQGKTINGQTYPNAYIDNKTYSNRTISVIWKDERYTDPQSLYDDAVARLAQLAIPRRTYDCAIVDLQATNPELYNNLDFSLFTTATLIDDAKETAVDYQVVERHIWPYHPDRNDVIFNSEPLKITSSITQLEYNIEDQGSPFNEIMKQRIASATNWLTSADGYIWIARDSDGWWKELYMMDTNDPSTARNLFRLNNNGIGISNNGLNGPYTSAWTIDGAFTANFITAGSMSMNRLSGGTLLLGGQNNGNGSLTVRNAFNQTIASISNSGITFNSNNFNVDSSGYLTCTGANVTGTITATSGTFTGTVNANNGYFKSGYFGTGGDWEITANGIHTKNGPTAPYGQSTKGTYVGTDGFCCNGSSSHVWISDGAFTTNGGIVSKGLTINSGGNMILHNTTINVVKSGSTYTGASGTITWVSGTSAYGLRVENGVVVYISEISS